MCSKVHGFASQEGAGHGSDAGHGGEHVLRRDKGQGWGLPGEEWRSPPLKKIKFFLNCSIFIKFE